MVNLADLKEIRPKPPSCSISAEHVQSGLPTPKAKRVRTMSPDDWEEFVEEWASSLKGVYETVRRFGGANDLGIDVAGFCTQIGFRGIWDNYQCKHYKQPLRPSDVWVEIGKIIYYSFLKEYTPPRKYYFVCSKGIGTNLEKLLNKPDELKNKTSENWEKKCQTGITTTSEIHLSGKLKEFFDSFDFTIFSSKSHLELIQSHSTTSYHIVRFGGGLPPRPSPTAPPDKPTQSESRYIRQLLDAYSDYLEIKLTDAAELEAHFYLKRDCFRQRERFYHAESLRNFARDTVPQGTFKSLQDEIYYGVVDVCEGRYVNGYERMKATITQASKVAMTSNPLVTATKTQDRQGVCHQLANDDRLIWVINHEQR